MAATTVIVYFNFFAKYATSQVFQPKALYKLCIVSHLFISVNRLQSTASRLWNTLNKTSGDSPYTFFCKLRPMDLIFMGLLQLMQKFTLKILSNLWICNLQVPAKAREAQP